MLIERTLVLIDVDWLIDWLVADYQAGRCCR